MWFLLIPIAAFVGSSVLPTIGFNAAGVGGGTIAAASIGNVTAGSGFATLQSAGATGVGNVIGGVCGAVTSIFSLFS